MEVQVEEINGFRLCEKISRSVKEQFLLKQTVKHKKQARQQRQVYFFQEKRKQFLPGETRKALQS